MALTVACNHCDVTFCPEDQQWIGKHKNKLKKQPRCWVCGRFLPKELVKINHEYTRLGRTLVTLI